MYCIECQQDKAEINPAFGRCNDCITKMSKEKLKEQENLSKHIEFKRLNPKSKFIKSPAPTFTKNTIIVCKQLYNENLVYIPAKYIIRFGFDEASKQTFIYTLDNVKLFTRISVAELSIAVMEALND